MKKIFALLLALALLCSCASLAETLLSEVGAELGADVIPEISPEFSFEEDMDSVYVISFEEAAELYQGEVPQFTAPEGFFLNDILVDDFGLTAYYSTVDPAAEEEEADAEDTDAEIDAEEEEIEETEEDYEDEAYASFEFSMYDYGKEEGLTHYNMTDGVLSDAVTAMVTIYEDEGAIYSADVYTSKGAVYFYFDGLDRAQVEAVLAGLTI